MQILGATDCRTDPYRPAFFVSKDDGTVGEVLANSTGVPGTNRYALVAVHLATSGTSHALHDLRFRNATRALWVTTGTATFTLNHTQFRLTDYPIYSANTGLMPVQGRNLLVHDGLYAFRGASNSSNWLEQVTVHRTSGFNAGGAIFLTNSLLISVTNLLTYTGANNVTNLDDTGFFQTVGAGRHYRASGASKRNSGTTNINPTLLANLKKRTTYPPIVLANNITSDTTLSAQAGRDTDTPDLGYHYDPLDFVASQIAVSNATLTLQAGTALGVYGSSSAPGLLLLDGGKVISTGAPDNLNRIVRYNLVQEEANNSWSTNSVHPFTALVRNATFAGGSVTVSNVAGGTWTMKDNLFETTNLLHRGVITHNCNGYLTNSVRLTNNAANDVLLTLTNIAYEVGPLGRFYLPTNLTSHSVLFNRGSQNATNAGLYHFTTVTNQTRELVSTVDLGFHSVAVNGSGQPIDTDSDGLADYFEDSNGNGSPGTGETSWQSYNSLNGLTGTPGLQVFTPLK